MERIIYRVSEINRFIKQIIDAEDILQNIWVKGEISNLRQPSSLHLYFTLKDEFSQIRCVMFKENSLALKFKPDNGMEVIAHGSISVYEKQGEYQLYVRELQPEGMGTLYLAFEQLKKKLSAEGLFAEERKRPIPFLPAKIGIITSSTGAALHDIVTTIRRRFPNISLILVPAVVQGEDAAPSIIHAINLVNKIEDVEVIILARGGGSLEELWPFNEESVARAIVASRIPVVTGIGHETDFTIADFCADLRAPTPTGAAERVVPNQEDLKRDIQNLRIRLKEGVWKNFSSLKMRLEYLKNSRAFRRPAEKILQYTQEIDELSIRLHSKISHYLQLKRENLTGITGRLESLSPLNIIARGYSLSRLLPEKRIIKRISEVQREDKMETRVSDGYIISRVEELIQGTEGGEGKSCLNLRVRNR